MKLKTTLAALAVAAATLAAPIANASTILIRDAGGDGITYPSASTLTLDVAAVDTAAFDTTSTRFAFLGEDSSSDSFTIMTTGNYVVEYGNVVTSLDYSKADLWINGTLIDLLLQGSQFVSVAVGSSFTVTMDFVAVDPAATYDFTLFARPIPIPAAGFLLVGALGGLGFAGRRRRKTA